VRSEEGGVRRKHHDLLAWTESAALVKDVYSLTASFPPSETYGLVAQMRRAAVSVPSNIAEGAAREGMREFAHYLVIARGSLSELETQLRIACELGFCADVGVVEEKIDRAFKLLGGLINKAREKA
jgi:four helix bundle protein